MSIYTDGKYLEKNPTYHIEDSSYKCRKFIKILKKSNLDFKAIKSIVEVGFGAGGILKQLYKRNIFNYEYIGLDINNEAGNTIHDLLNTINYDKNLEVTWYYNILSDSLILDSDIYEVFPFFMIDHDSLLTRMIQAIAGDSALFFSKHYLEIPCDIITDTLVIN